TPATTRARKRRERAGCFIEVIRRGEEGSGGSGSACRDKPSPCKVVPGVRGRKTREGPPLRRRRISLDGRADQARADAGAASPGPPPFVPDPLSPDLTAFPALVRFRASVSGGLPCFARFARPI